MWVWFGLNMHLSYVVCIQAGLFSDVLESVYPWYITDPIIQKLDFQNSANSSSLNMSVLDWWCAISSITINEVQPCTYLPCTLYPMFVVMS